MSALVDAVRQSQVSRRTGTARWVFRRIFHRARERNAGQVRRLNVVQKPWFYVGIQMRSGKCAFSPQPRMLRVNSQSCGESRFLTKFPRSRHTECITTVCRPECRLQRTSFPLVWLQFPSENKGKRPIGPSGADRAHLNSCKMFRQVCKSYRDQDSGEQEAHLIREPKSSEFPG